MKKGEITTSQIVALILIILGLVILLFVYSQLSWSGMVDKNVCKQSVLYRGTSHYVSGTTSYVPLKCYTEKVCITSGLFGGSCKEFENVKGVVKVKVKNKQEVEQYITRSILDCWEMMGEGKISMFSNWLADTYGIGGVYPSCSVCTRIAFDNKSLEKSGINLKELDVVKYMMTHNIPNKNVTYFSYIGGNKGKFSVNKDSQISNLRIDEKGNLVEGEPIQVDMENPYYSMGNEELSIMFMQISAPSHSKVITNTLTSLGIGYGASFFVAPMSVGKSTLALIKSPYAWAMLIIAGAYQQYSVAANKAVTAGYCGDISTGDSAREGCSVVRTVNYNAEEISNYCAVIESIP